MQRRESRTLTIELHEVGLPDDVAAEIHAAASHEPARRRPRVTAEVAEFHAHRVVEGALTADAFYERVWGMSIAEYFEPVVAAPRRADPFLAAHVA